MPRISAPTVAEHRAAQRAALIAAGEAVIREQGVAAVTPRTVGERAGLARSSFYEYFPSRDDLLAAIAVNAFDALAAEVDAVVAAAPPGRARLHAYVAATMRMSADGNHDLATGLRDAELAPKDFAAIMAMHDRLTGPLRTLLEELGVPDAGTRAILVQGLVNAGVQLVAHGVPVETVIDSVVRMLDHGLGGALQG